MHIDERELAFPHASDGEFHAWPRELSEDAEPKAYRAMLRTLYRFGGPLEPGFHHDVQRLHGRDLVAMPFPCSEAGAVTVTGTHANVYPNDFVRAKGKA